MNLSVDILMPSLCWKTWIFGDAKAEGVLSRLVEEKLAQNREILARATVDRENAERAIAVLTAVQEQLPAYETPEPLIF